MKRIFMILALIGFILAACSPAPGPEPEPDPDPIPGVIDISGFSGVDIAYIGFLCMQDGTESLSRHEIFGVGESIDLDQFRQDCSGKVFDGEFTPPEELLNAGLKSITGVSLLWLDLESDSGDEYIPLWPNTEGYDQNPFFPFVFYANSGGKVEYSGLIGAQSASISPLAAGSVTYSINATYSPGWNVYAEKTNFSGEDAETSATIFPLDSLEWVEAPHRAP